MRNISLFVLLFGLSLCLSVCVALAGAKPATLSFEMANSMTPPIKVGVILKEPFVMKTPSGHLEGFTVDLLKAVSEETGRSISLQEMDIGQLTALKKGSVDVLAGGMNAIYDLEKDGVIFSYPTFDTGQAILVKKELDTVSVIPIIMKNLFTWELAKMLLFLFGVLFFWGFWLWLAEKGEDVIHDSFFTGFKDAVWCAWAIKTTIGFGDVYPKRFLGRALTVPIFFSGAVLLAVVAAPINAAFVERNMGAVSSSISSIDDLSRKTVATQAGALSEKILKRKNVKLVTTSDISEAYELLMAEKVEAVVFDSPVLLYHVKQNPDMVIVGDTFAKHHYGFAFSSENEQLRNQVDLALLNVRKKGIYDSIYNKWF